MTGTSAKPKRKNPLQRVRNFFPRSRASVSNQTNLASSTSPSIAKSIPLKPPSPTPEIAQPSLSSRSSNADAEDRSGSPTAQIVSPAQRNPSAVSTLHQKLLEKALELLGEQEKAVIKQHIVNTKDIGSAVQAALNAAQEKQKLCESKRWTFSIRGHVVKLQDVADKVISWLDRFKQIGDIAANADPIHAGLPWAGIRFLLEVLKGRG
jgi:hypothetical protein